MSPHQDTGSLSMPCCELCPQIGAAVGSGSNTASPTHDTVELRNQRERTRGAVRFSPHTRGDSTDYSSILLPGAKKRVACAAI